MSPKYLQLIKLLAKMATKGAGKVPEGVKGVAKMRGHQKGRAPLPPEHPKGIPFTEWLKKRDLYKGNVNVPYKNRGGTDYGERATPNPTGPRAPKKGPSGKAPSKRRTDFLRNLLSTKGKKNPFTAAKADKTGKSQRPLPNEEEARLIAQMKAEYSNTPQGPLMSTPLSKALAGQAKKGNLNPQGRLKRLETSPEQFMNDLAGGSLHKGKGGPIQLTKEELQILNEHVKAMKSPRGGLQNMKAADHEYGPMKSGEASLNAALLSALGSGAGAAGLGGALQNRSRGSAGGSPQPPSR
tara:strand:- start:3267 stop:4154 length:888 start_codon:yes stop_codon:yes gene_type:complete